jgi:hypothetical protein
MSDITAVTGKVPKIHDAASEMNGSKCYTIYLPYSLARAMASLSGMTVGRRTIQEASYPSFLWDSPTAIIREFLAGCFGGDGWTTYLSGNQFSNVGFSQSICTEFLESLEERMDQFVTLMDVVGVKAHISRTRLCHMKTETYQNNPRASVEVIVASNTEFYEKIGFRHCVEKQMRLEASVAYEGYCKEVRRQHDAAMAAVDASMLTTKSYPVALETVKKLYETEKPLNEYYSLLTRTLIGNRRKPGRSTELRVFDYNYMLSAPEWAKAHGCIDWFSKTSYTIPRDATDIPTYTMGLMRSEVSHDAPVYDIGVSKTHYFIAQGCAVHNCIPSRMTIAQLMETVLGRLGCEEGFLGDATPFNTAMTAAGLGDELQKRGLEPYSNEVLYCGYTGKQMPTNIFMGPCFYQRLKHMVCDKIHCLTPEHDVLTLDGWKPITSVTTDDAVATLQDGKVIYAHPSRTYIYNYQGPMYEIMSQQVNLKVTPNHRMWVATCHTRKRVWKYGFHEARDIKGKRVKYQKDGIWNTEDYQFILPAHGEHEDKLVDMDAWLTFFGIWIAEGWCNRAKLGMAVNKERVKNALSDAMMLLEFKYNYYPGTEKLESTDQQLKNYMTTLSVGANNKYLPEWVWNLSANQCQTLLHGLLLGDGHTSGACSEVYSTSSFRLANDVQRLALHCGWSANIRLHTAAGTPYTIDNHSGFTTTDLWNVRIIKSKNRPEVNHGHCHEQFGQIERMVDYDGTVHCLEVPGGVFYVRRHGIPVWTGNSRATGPLVMLTRQPAEGRARDGGLRFGEMERDCMIAHGASAFLKERMMEASDNFEVHVCKGCGLIGVANKARNIWNCTGCGNTTEFSQVRIPYAYKLFLQELESMNVSSRILPETRLRSLTEGGGR